MQCRLLLIADQTEGAYTRMMIDRIDEPECTVEVCNTFDRGRKRVTDGAHDVVLVHEIGDQDGGVAFLESVRVAGSDVPVIIVADHPSIDLDDSARLAGAVDYLDKDQLSPKTLGEALQNAMRLAAKVRRARPRGARKREGTSRTYMANYALDIVARSAEQNAETASAMRELTGQMRVFMDGHGERDVAAAHTQDEIKTGLFKINETMGQVGGALEKMAEGRLEHVLRLIRENGKTFGALAAIVLFAALIVTIILIAAPAENLRAVKEGISPTEEVQPFPPPPFPPPPAG